MFYLVNAYLITYLILFLTLFLIKLYYCDCFQNIQFKHIRTHFDVEIIVAILKWKYLHKSPISFRSLRKQNKNLFTGTRGCVLCPAKFELFSVMIEVIIISSKFIDNCIFIVNIILIIMLVFLRYSAGFPIPFITK